METILEKILNYKKKEIENNKSLYPVKLFEKSIYFRTPTISLCGFLQRKDSTGIIAEFKRRSPSKGIINEYAKVEEVSIGYMQAGASAISVLTDQHFFGGKNKDLTEARTFNYAPILNKNFIIDEYQIIEARSIGADVILLIAECLSKEKLRDLASVAKNLGMEVLLEIHSAEQLKKLCPEVDLVGVNNRNLKTFEVDIENSINIAKLLPKEILKIAESGLNNPDTIIEMKKHGFNGFLIGEHFMKHGRPHAECARFIQQIKQKSKSELNYEN
ncbi:MAG: indole-3-glycerol phosphate synthase TrpC [Saprospiraceae bacterium]|nr:indole-3-glycerol phosphate synthase TrpC [Saprospiraceae bacterium]